MGVLPIAAKERMHLHDEMPARTVSTQEIKVLHGFYITINIFLVKESSLESYARVISMKNRSLDRIETKTGSPLRVQYDDKVDFV